MRGVEIRVDRAVDEVRKCSKSVRVCVCVSERESERKETVLRVDQSRLSAGRKDCKTSE